MLSDMQIDSVGRRIAVYRPLPEARKFHGCLKKYRWFFGGNRSGKSEANIGYDLCSFALGVHPYRLTPKKAVIWAAAPSWPMVGKILWKEKIRDYLPARRVVTVAWHRKEMEEPAEVLLDNGTMIEFKAYEQGRVAFQGRAIDAFYGDEQCEHDSEAIQQEVDMRLLDRQGFSSQSMTPLIPQPWLEKRVLDPPETDGVFYADLNDNRKSRGGYIDDAEIDLLIAAMPEEVQETRVKGRFAAFVGVVYKGFRREIHVCRLELPADAERYRGIDFGFNNPFVCLWVGRYGADRRWHVYREHYRAQDSLANHARRIHELSGAERYVATWADHDAQDVYELAEKRLATLPAKKDVRLGIELVQARLKVQADGRPMLTMDPACEHLIDEMIGYRWREGTDKRDPRDEPEKKDDHCPDALRYVLYSVEGGSYFQR